MANSPSRRIGRATVGEIYITSKGTHWKILELTGLEAYIECTVSGTGSGVQVGCTMTMARESADDLLHFGVWRRPVPPVV